MKIFGNEVEDILNEHINAWNIHDKRFSLSGISATIVNNSKVVSQIDYYGMGSFKRTKGVEL
ncbi:MAG: hypothetical protein ACRBHB_09925 [Arenicella sp.]